MELEEHKSKVEETKASLQNYTLKVNAEKESDVKDLLAIGEEATPEVPEPVKVKKKTRIRRKKDDSDSEEMEDWEEVNGLYQNYKSYSLIVVFFYLPKQFCRIDLYQNFNKL